jgi:PAS domain S-box-containing protein
VFWKDKDLVYLGCNTIFARDAGFADSKDIVGKDDFQMVWRDQADSYRSDDRQVIESGNAKLFIEEPQTTPAGDTITLLTSKIPLRNFNGEICGILGTYIDITDRKKADDLLRAAMRRTQEEKARFEAIIAGIADGITIQDREFKIVFQNEVQRRLMGDQLGKYCFEAYEHKDHICEGCPVAKSFESGEVQTTERTIVLDNRTRHFEIVSSPLKNADGVIVSCIEMVREVTERRLIEEEEKKRLRELEIFHKASFGREERILELKKEVERLKKELEK